MAADILERSLIFPPRANGEIRLPAGMVVSIERLGRDVFARMYRLIIPCGERIVNLQTDRTRDRGRGSEERSRERLSPSRERRGRV